MKKIIETTDASGLEALLGERVRLMCVNYFYAGKLVGVNTTFVQLDDTIVVYDSNDKGVATVTGGLPSKTWYVQIAAIESFGIDK